MKIEVTDLENEIIYNARPGPQTIKLIEIEEQMDENYNTIVVMKFVNQWEEFHIEKFDPIRHRKRIYQIASAIGEECFIKHDDGTISIDTDKMIGGYFRCSLEHVETKNGEITRSLYIRDIKASTRRRDATGSRHFKRLRRRKNDKTNVS